MRLVCRLTNGTHNEIRSVTIKSLRLLIWYITNHFYTLMGLIFHMHLDLQETIISGGE
jgi:hypothetical protein